MAQEQTPRKRVWQLTDINLIEKRRMPKFVTLNWRDKDQGIGHYAAIVANPAAQYVLHEGAEYWEKQNKAMEGYAKSYGLVEVGAEKEGDTSHMPKPKPLGEEAVKQVEELQKQNAQLLKRLEALEALRGSKKEREDR